MRVTINLASRPFLELKPVYARLRLMMALLAFVAAGLGAWLYVASRKDRVAKDEMERLVAQTQAFQQERAQNEARMRRPENRSVLERAQFLNTVFAQKGFSWTSVMMDLEQVLPAGVQVTSIEPSVAADGTVSIHMRVNGPRELAVDLVRNLEHSRRFLEPHLMSESAQTQENGRALPVTGAPGGVQFEILSGYNPLPVPVDTKRSAPLEREISAAARASGVMGATPKVPASPVPHKRAGLGRESGATLPGAPGNQVPQPKRAPANGGPR